MTDKTTAPASPGPAAFTPGGTAPGTTVASRLLEVATWVWRVVAVGIACWFVAAAGVLYVEYGRPEEVAGLLAFYLGGALVLGLAVWAVRYVLTGERRSFPATLRAACFGNLALYFWFVPAVLVAGAFGTALWHDAAQDQLRLQHLSEGVGGAIFVLLLGAPGWFFAPRGAGHVGHMIGTVLAAGLSLGALFLAG